MKNLIIKVDSNCNKSIIAINYLCECGYSFIINKYTFLSHLREEHCYVYILGCYDGKIRYSRQTPRYLDQCEDITNYVFKSIPNKATIF